MKRFHLMPKIGTYKDKNYVILPTGLVKTCPIRFDFDYAAFEHTDDLEMGQTLISY